MNFAVKEFRNFSSEGIAGWNAKYDGILMISGGDKSHPEADEIEAARRNGLTIFQLSQMIKRNAVLQKRSGPFTQVETAMKTGELITASVCLPKVEHEGDKVKISIMDNSLDIKGRDGGVRAENTPLAVKITDSNGSTDVQLMVACRIAASVCVVKRTEKGLKVEGPKAQMKKGSYGYFLMYNRILGDCVKTYQMLERYIHTFAGLVMSAKDTVLQGKELANALYAYFERNKLRLAFISSVMSSLPEFDQKSNSGFVLKTQEADVYEGG